MNEFDIDDDLPFSPIESNEDNNLKDNNEKIINKDENLSNIQNIEEESKILTIDDSSDKKDDDFIGQEENTNLNDSNSIFLPKDIKDEDIESLENLFKTKDTSDSNINSVEEVILNSDTLNNDSKPQEKKQIKINKLKINNNISNKIVKVLPIFAFLFVLILSIYIFIYNAKADISNLIKIEEKSKVGYINNSGEVIVRPKYLYGTDYYKGYAVVKNYNSLYGILDSKGNNEIAFGNIFSATLYKNRYVVSKFTNDGLKMGLLDEKLEELSRFKYDNITYSKAGIFIFTKDETMGIMNDDGKEIYTYKVDEVDDRNITVEVSNSTNNKSPQYAKIKINSSSTIININTGKEVYKYTLSDINVLDNNVFYIKNESGLNRYFIIKDDKIIYETNNYKRIRIDDINSDIAIGIKEDTKIDYINLLTKQVINLSDEIKYTYSNGVILEKKYDFNLKKNIYTIYTPKKVLGTFSDIDPYDDEYINGYMKIKTKNDKYSFVNKKGDIITKNEYDEVSNFNENGYAVVSNDNSYGVIDSKGKEIVDKKFDGIVFLNNRLFKTIRSINNKELFIYKEDDKFGIIDSNGNVLIKAVYDEFVPITNKYPIIKATYGGEELLINLASLKELNIKVFNDVEVYDNYIVCMDKYYNYNGDLIYESGGSL